MFACSKETCFVVVDFFIAKNLIYADVVVLAWITTLLILLRPPTIRKQSIIVSIFHFSNFLTCSIFVAVVVGAEAWWPAAGGGVWAVQTHLRFLCSYTRAAIRMIRPNTKLSKPLLKLITIFTNFFSIGIEIEGIWLPLTILHRKAIKLPIICFKLSIHLTTFSAAKWFCWGGAVSTS